MFIDLAARCIEQRNQVAQKGFQLFRLEDHRRHEQGGWPGRDQCRIALDEPFNILLVLTGIHSRLAFSHATRTGPKARSEAV